MVTSALCGFVITIQQWQEMPECLSVRCHTEKHNISEG